MERAKHVKTEYEQTRSRFREASSRHVLVLEADFTPEKEARHGRIKKWEEEQLKKENSRKRKKKEPSPPDTDQAGPPENGQARPKDWGGEKACTDHFFRYADRLRKLGNEVTAYMKSNYSQLARTKRYRNLKRLYGKYKNADDKKALKHISEQLKSMQEAYGVTKDACEAKARELNNGRYGLNSVFVLTKADDIWSGMEDCLYKDGKEICFKKHGDLPALRAKQACRSILITAQEGCLMFQCDSFLFTGRVKDRFQEEEVAAICRYLSQPEVEDRKAVEEFGKDGTLTDTFRPCYASLVCKEIRGKQRLFVHITVEGKAVPKKKKDGSRRHTYGTGRVGGDVGTQTIAYTSKNEVGLENLAERGRHALKNEKKAKTLNRAMERSRRGTNPENYKPDGTIKKDRKRWKKSKRYKKMEARYKELCRINAENRKYAINETVNKLRSLGDTFITESKNAAKLMKRSKKTEREEKVSEIVQKDGSVKQVKKYKKKRRFGRSVQRRCPGYFQAQMERKFTSTGGSYHEVPRDYRASQYDHTSGEYEKKSLSDRMYSLSDGTVVQRDIYSSFLMYNTDDTYTAIDRGKCIASFPEQYKMQQEVIEKIKKEKKNVLNSGIKAS